MDSEAPHLGVSLPCEVCGYDLRGLDRTGVCPECATPVANSIRTERLQFANGAWLATLHRGAKMVIAGAALAPIALVGSIVVGLATGAGEVSALLGVLVVALMIVVACRGWWHLAARDPGGATGRSVVAMYLRVSAVVFAAGTVGLALCAAAELMGSASPLRTPAVATTLLVGMFLVWFVACIAAMLQVRVLFDRVPDELGTSLSMAMVLASVVLNVMMALVFALGPILLLIAIILIVNRLRRRLAEVRAAKGRMGSPGLTAP